MHLIPLGVVSRLCRGVHIDGTHNETNDKAILEVSVPSYFGPTADLEDFSFADIDPNSEEYQTQALWQGIQQQQDALSIVATPGQQSSQPKKDKNRREKKVKNPIFRKTDLDHLGRGIKNVSNIPYNVLSCEWATQCTEMALAQPGRVTYRARRRELTIFDQKWRVGIREPWADMD